MADDWIAEFTPLQTDWNIPGPALAELAAHRDTAREALETAQKETTRTPVSNTRCRDTFNALTGFMRDFKRRYFLTPPFGGVPTAQVTVETYLVGRRQLGVRITYVTGSPDDKANKGYRIWYSVLAPDEPPPSKPEELRNSFYTQRKKDLIEFENGDSGNTVWFAVQIENDGRKGNWGPMVSAQIP
jgi:hypothetical protein